MQKNIASVKDNKIYPGVLIFEDVERYKIDYFKLKLIRMGVINYKND